MVRLGLPVRFLLLLRLRQGPQLLFYEDEVFLARFDFQCFEPC